MVMDAEFLAEPGDGNRRVKMPGVSRGGDRTVR